MGDGLVSQIPALIVSLSAGLLVSKGGTKGSAEKAVLGQLGAYPRALFVSAGLLFALALVPGLPLIPFAALGGLMAFVGYAVPKQLAKEKAEKEAKEKAVKEQQALEVRESVKEQLKTAEIEVVFDKQLAGVMTRASTEFGQRIAKMRRKFAQRYGFVVPDVKISESLNVPAKTYQIKIHGTVVTSQEMRIGELLVVTGDGAKPDVPGDEVREPAFGMKAMWVAEAYQAEVRREGFTAVDNSTVILTHLSEVIANNLPQLLSYKDMRTLLDRLDPEYKRLIEDICPSQISYSGLQAVLKLLLSERVSIRNLHLILEAIAEIVPHARRSEQVAEHVRMRMAQQICGDLADGGVLRVLRLGSKWDLTSTRASSATPRATWWSSTSIRASWSSFGTDASVVVREQMKEGQPFVLVSAPDARPYVRMIIERMFPSLPVLSHVEIARGVEIKSLGTIS